MSDSVFDASNPAELEFSHADVAGDPQACAACQTTIGSRYFDVGGAHTCEACGVALRDGQATPAARAVRALLFGSVAALLSGLVWYGIRAATGYEVGLIAIGVGFAVGFGVRKGGYDRGGWFYQALAIGLTYTAISLTYVPDVIEAMTAPEMATELEGSAAGPDAVPGSVEVAPPPAEEASVLLVLIAIFLSFAVPFLQAFDGGAMGLIIVLIALYEAWKINKKVELDIHGPFETTV